MPTILRYFVFYSVAPSKYYDSTSNQAIDAFNTIYSYVFTDHSIFRRYVMYVVWAPDLILNKP
jgi:hypothetical protein